jgi:hypothetical protein
MEELSADDPKDPQDPQDPLARLVFLVHLERPEGEFVTEPAVTACYEAKFNYYGIMGSPGGWPAHGGPLRSPRRRWSPSRRS